MVQLGIHWPAGHGCVELVREHFGLSWAWLVVAVLAAVAVAGSLVREFTVVAGIGVRRPRRDCTLI
jgi:hypothetical protein